MSTQQTQQTQQDKPTFVSAWQVEKQFTIHGTRYDVHGPDKAFVVFNGPNAKSQCDDFIKLMRARELEKLINGLETKY